MWDPRAGREPRHRLAPHTQAQLARPHLGRFVASLDLYNDWLVSGLHKLNGHMGSLSVQLLYAILDICTYRFRNCVSNCQFMWLILTQFIANNEVFIGMWRRSKGRSVPFALPGPDHGSPTTKACHPRY